MYKMARLQHVQGEGGWWGVASILSVSLRDEEA